MEIPLTKGLVAIIDEADFPLISNFKWCAFRSSTSRENYYAQSRSGKERRCILLHRVIMNAPHGSLVDHKDGNGLNCTRANMRFATRSQNGYNSIRPVAPGAYWEAEKQKWSARISVQGKVRRLGRYNTREEAVMARDIAAIKYHGEFASVTYESARNLVLPSNGGT